MYFTMPYTFSLPQEGVQFQSPHDNSMMLLTPEHSIQIQNTIGADIIMQLDDVVHVKMTGPRVEEAMWRSVRWLDRCVNAHKRPESQNLFGIIQGGLQEELRRKCVSGNTMAVAIVQYIISLLNLSVRMYAQQRSMVLNLSFFRPSVCNHPTSKTVNEQA